MWIRRELRAGPLTVALARSLVFCKHTLECYAFPSLPPSVPLSGAPLNLLLLTVHPHTLRIYLQTSSLLPPPPSHCYSCQCFIFLGFVFCWTRPSSQRWEWIRLCLLKGCQLDTHPRVLTETHPVFLLSSLLSQDPSEVENPREHGGHPGGLPGDGHLCQSGHGAAAVLLRHHDQDHLHQL